MMDAFIFTGGDVLLKNIKIAPEKGDLVIAADAGYKTAEAMGIPVDVLIGDMDSLGRVPENLKNTEIVRLPADKDVTDTEAAVEYALKHEHEVKFISIIGGIGSRLDHTMANLSILESIERLYSAPLGKHRTFFGLKKQARMSRNIGALLTNGYNRVRFIRNNSVILPKNPYFKYLSLLCADEYAKGVCVEGCKYPLNNASLSRHRQYFSVSNEILGNCAFVSVRSGGLFIVESMDT